MPLQRFGPSTTRLDDEIKNVGISTIFWSVPPGDRQWVTLEGKSQPPRQDRHMKVISRSDGPWSSELNPEDDHLSRLRNPDDLRNVDAPVSEAGISEDLQRRAEDGSCC